MKKEVEAIYFCKNNIEEARELINDEEIMEKLYDIVNREFSGSLNEYNSFYVVIDDIHGNYVVNETLFDMYYDNEGRCNNIYNLMNLYKYTTTYYYYIPETNTNMIVSKYDIGDEKDIRNKKNWNYFREMDEIYGYLYSNKEKYDDLYNMRLLTEYDFVVHENKENI